jgi:hypothetical protein
LRFIGVLEALNWSESTVATASGEISSVVRGGGGDRLLNPAWSLGRRCWLVDNVVATHFPQMCHWGVVSLGPNLIHLGKVASDRPCEVRSDSTVLRAHERLVEAALHAGEENPVGIKNLVFNDFGLSSVVSLFHDDAFLKGHIQIHFESFVLEFLNHSDVGNFKIPYAQFKYFELLLKFFQKNCLFEQGVEDAI